MSDGVSRLKRLGRANKRVTLAAVAGLLVGASLVAAFLVPAYRGEARLADKYFAMYLEAGNQPSEAVAKREREVLEREAELDATANELKEREDEVRASERKAKRKIVPGEGTYEVGVDMKAGTYRAPASPTCYWSINADPNGTRIISNDNTDGQFVVRVENGQYLELSRCADLVRQ